MADTIVNVRGVQRSYRRGKTLIPVLRGLDLAVERGEMVSLMGPSGGGKTTLLHLVGGLDRPDAGEIEVDGTDLVAADESGLDRFRRRSIGFVFQFFNLLSNADAQDNVAFGLLAKGVAWKEARSRAADALVDLGLGDRLDHRPAELSGGEQQRVAIARAVVAEPALLLADEPTGDVDDEATKQIVSTLVSLNRDRGITVVLATHDPNVAAHTGRIVRLRDGLAVDTGP